MGIFCIPLSSSLSPCLCSVRKEHQEERGWGVDPRIKPTSSSVSLQRSHCLWRSVLPNSRSIIALSCWLLTDHCLGATTLTNCNCDDSKALGRQNPLSLPIAENTDRQVGPAKSRQIAWPSLTTWRCVNQKHSSQGVAEHGWHATESPQSILQLLCQVSIH